MSATRDDPGLLEAVFSGAADAIVVVDTEGVIVAANSAAHDLLGAQDLVGGSVDEFVPEPARAAHRGYREVFAAQGSTRRMGAGHDLVARRGDGTLFPVDIALSTVEIDGAPHVVASMRDLTTLVDTREQLESSRSQLAIMEDRDRIARDLHDTVIQDIFAAGLGLKAIQATLTDPDAVQRVNSTVDQLDSAIARLRRVIFDLRVRTGEGITTTVERVVARLVAGSGVQADVQFGGPLESLTARIREHLVATIREAVANVVRHARAHHALVDVHVTDRECIVRVSDDGVGPGESAGVGFGLDNMANRAAALGGGFSFGEVDSGGSAVTWWVPLPDNQAKTRSPASKP